MKYSYNILHILLFLLTVQFSFAQTIIWSEDFDGNGGTGSNWGTLNQDIGVQGVNANQWYISSQECGNAVGACGSSCAGDASLHVGANPGGFGDVGAAYDATAPSGLCGFAGTLFCDPTTNKRSQSININTIGQSNISLQFNYIENGQGALDDAVVEYSTDGGGTWILLTNTPKSTAGACAPQHIWRSFSIPLPAACENINNLRLAFRWQNNADGIGTDPSFAVDEIQLTTPVTAPVELLSFEGYLEGNKTILNWETATEVNSDFFEVERSSDASDFESIGVRQAKGTPSSGQMYQLIDYAPQYGDNYYRLKQIDKDGEAIYSTVIYMEYTATIIKNLVIAPNPTKGNTNIYYYAPGQNTVAVKVVDMLGQVVLETTKTVSKGNNHIYVDLSDYTVGTYLLKVIDEGRLYSQLFIKK